MVGAQPEKGSGRLRRECRDTGAHPVGPSGHSKEFEIMITGFKKRSDVI